MTNQALEARVARAQAALATYPDLLLDMPHPDRRRAADGYKLRGKVMWLFRHAGAAGRTQACKWVEEAVRRRQEPALRLGHPSVAKRS